MYVRLISLGQTTVWVTDEVLSFEKEMADHGSNNNKIRFLDTLDGRGISVPNFTESLSR